MDWSTLTMALVPGLFVSVVTAFVTAYFTAKWSIAQFHSQRWWELKVEAYSQIIARLVDLQYHLGHWYDVFLLDKELDSESEKELGESYRQAKEYITKAAAAGAYIVSDDTASALERLLRELEQRHPNVVEEINLHYGAVKRCIARIREYAKADLHKR